MNLKFDATPTTFHLTQAKLTSGNSQLILDATIENYNAPTIRAQYNANVDGAELAQILHNPSLPGGMVSATGSLQYQQVANRSFLEAVIVNGDVKSRRLIVKTPQAKTEIGNVVAHYSLANGDALLRDFRANLLGGEIKAQGTMKRITGESSSRFNAVVRGVSLASVRSLLGTTTAGSGVAVEGVMNASATGTWGKTFDDLVAHADVTMSGKIAHSRQANQTPTPGSNSPDSTMAANTIPVDALIHATYYGSGQRVALDKSYLHTPQTSLTMNGVVSDKSILALQLSKCPDRDKPLPSLQSSAPGTAFSMPAGTASFQGVVQGSVAVPHLTGQLAAQNLQANGTTWKVLRTHVDLSPSQISLQQGNLEPADRGKVTFNATAGLQKWSFSDTSPDCNSVKHIADGFVGVGEIVAWANTGDGVVKRENQCFMAPD